MLLHEPVLSFNIDNFSKRKLNYCFYKRKEFINLEGFGNENTPCIIVLPPPLLKNKYPFNGLRPAVYMLSESNVNNEIINQCEINEKNKEEKYAEINKNNEIFRKNQNISVCNLSLFPSEEYTRHRGVSAKHPHFRQENVPRSHYSDC